ncbi:MAG: cation-translocating P-type ATPase [Gemmatimonadaceae bacterium]
MTRDLTDAYRLTADEVAAALATDRHRGVTASEAAKRLEELGRNELTSEARVSGWRRFLSQFRDVLVILLLVATAVSVGLWFVERDTALPYESIAIFAVVLLNATMGFIQESRAEAAVTALRAMSASEASVIRDGERRRVAAAELVPGDVILIEQGDTIPADARVMESTALMTAEAALTGESLPVSKNAAPIADEAAVADRENMIFSGTAATYGRGTALVTATGMRTEVGRIAGLLHESPAEVTPLQRELDRTGKILGFVVLAIAAIMIVTIILVEDVHGISGILDVLILGVALAVAAVPEGLPAVVTAVLSIGVQRMARRNAIVRHLAAVETLGSASVIASDKTGTLTRNEMTVRVVVTASGRVSFSGSGYSPEGEVQREGGGSLAGALRAELERALAAADLANNATVREENGRWMVEGDPTEGALLVAARKAGFSETFDARFSRVGEIPFSSERKLMSTLHRDRERGDKQTVFTKGAPDVLLARCSWELVGENQIPLTTERRAEIEQTNLALADEALRTLGVAIRRLTEDVPLAAGSEVESSVEQDLIFAGLIGMIDPPRAEAGEAVARAKRAGIRPIMITGDHPRTAAVIARELGISSDGRTMTGVELDQQDDDALARTVADVSVYARVNPDHKLRIVKALQRDRAIVAMTGDGVNDAPALKTADIGVAMGVMGTDVAREAADIVLADDNFASIVAAVDEGRAIFANIRTFLRYLLSSNIGEVLTMFFGVLLATQLGLPSENGVIVLPLLATQLLWINLVTDGAPALALGVDPPEEDLMRQPPRPNGEPVITGEMWRGIFFNGVVMAIATLLVLDASLPGGYIPGNGNLRYAQTMTFTCLTLAQFFNVFNSRSDRRSAFAGIFSNRWVWGALALSLALQLLVTYLPAMQQAFGTMPLSLTDWVKCLIPASAVLWARELWKILRRQTTRSRADA